MVSLVAIIALASVRKVGQTLSCTFISINSTVYQTIRAGLPLMPTCSEAVTIDNGEEEG